MTVIDRRRFLQMGAGMALGATAGATLLPRDVLAGIGNRTLNLYAINTQERLTADYWVDGWYNPDALHACNVLLRDRRTDEVTEMDPNLLDLVYLLHRQTGSREPVEIICGYRSPRTNARLAAQGRGVASNSYHVRGQAIDLAVPGFNLSGLRQTARSMEMGGVGYYPRAGFVHVDTGPVRTW